ncbi:outer membrane protein [Luteolibacter sp. Populi]|uniref:outer membrane protein n=1 Tax=Luteolibacter sp. Populi TaxID=3230487 RepID=UPI0034673A09
MKTTATMGLALLLGASAYAGEVTSTTNTYTPPPSSPSLYTWFVGGSGGYFFDNEEEFWTLHFGMKIAESGPITHSLFVEGLYTEWEPTLGLDSEIIPVTLNYKLDYAINDRLSFYAGLGAGAAFIDNQVLGFSDDSVELTAQAFVGLGFDVTQNFQIYSGARYLWVDDSDFFRGTVDNGDDVGAELGIRFKF